ncbi:transposase, partial [Candidatus Mycobacterium methanotrophicum]
MRPARRSRRCGGCDGGDLASQRRGCRGNLVGGAPGKKAATLDRFFTEALPEDGANKIEAVSMDLGPAFAKSVRAH